MSKKFGQVPRHVCRRAAAARLSGRAWSVLVTLYGFADSETGRAYPGLTCLAAETGIDPRDIPRIINRELAPHGLVTVVRNGASYKGRKCNLYLLPTAVQNTDGEITVGDTADGEVAPHTTVQINGETYQETDHSSRKARAHSPVPQDWGASDRNRAFARKLGYSDPWIEAEALRFRDHHRSKGTLFADIDAGWQTWVRRAADFKSRVVAASGAQNQRNSVTLRQVSRVVLGDELNTQCGRAA